MLILPSPKMNMGGKCPNASSFLLESNNVNVRRHLPRRRNAWIWETEGQMNSINIYEVIRAILDFFIQNFHKHKKHKTLTSEQK